MSLNDTPAVTPQEDNKNAVEPSKEVLTENQISALEWALNFMRTYEKRK